MTEEDLLRDTPCILDFKEGMVSIKLGNHLIEQEIPRNEDDLRRLLAEPIPKDELNMTEEEAKELIFGTEKQQQDKKKEEKAKEAEEFKNMKAETEKMMKKLPVEFREMFQGLFTSLEQGMKETKEHTHQAPTKQLNPEATTTLKQKTVGPVTIKQRPSPFSKLVHQKSGRNLAVDLRPMQVASPPPPEP